MHLIEIQNTNTKIDFPEHLGEYTNQQYLDFCELLTQFQADVISYEEFRIKLTYKLMNMVHSKKKLSEEEAETRNENIYRLSLFIDALFADKKVGNKIFKSIDLSFVDNKIPQFEYNNVIYYGPEDALLNITFDEILAAIEYFNIYNKTLAVEDLNKLVATLYRPKKQDTETNILTNYEGDIRQEFYSTNIDLRAKKLENLPLHIKIGIKLFFEACINFIATAKNVTVQGNDIDLSVLFQGTASNKNETSKEKGIGMLSVLFSLSETHVFGNKKETGKERYWTILLKLYQNHIDVEQQKQKIKDAKSK